jgi:hypothetical protein
MAARASRASRTGFSLGPLPGACNRPHRPVRAVAAVRRPRPRRDQREHPSRRRRCRRAVLLPAPQGQVRKPAGGSSETGAGEEARPLACLPSHSLQPLRGNRNAAITSTVRYARQAMRSSPACFAARFDAIAGSRPFLAEHALATGRHRRRGRAAEATSTARSALIANSSLAAEAQP